MTKDVKAVGPPAVAAPAPPPSASTCTTVAGGGLAALALAAALHLAGNAGWAVATQALLTLAGLIAVALPITWRWQEWGWYAVGTGAALLAQFALPESWATAHLVCAVLCGFAFSGTVILLLPPPARRAAVGVWLLFHFGGILTAVTSPPATPYWTGQLWTRVYRPYLQFFYLNNAYHFYSPEPGPASLCWFCVKYDNEGVPEAERLPDHWLKLPRRPQDVKDPLAIEYYRRLSVTEQTAQTLPGAGLGSDEAIKARLQVQNFGDVVRKVPRIPLLPTFQVPMNQQRLVPVSRTQEEIIPNYIRYVAGHAPHPERVRVVRLYRVIHQITAPENIARGVNPYLPTTYRPYYLGEYTPRGDLKDPDDPLLYWLIPITSEPKPGVVLTKQRDFDDPANFDFVDYLAIHAGSDHGEFIGKGN